MGGVCLFLDEEDKMEPFSSPNTFLRWQPKIVKTSEEMVVVYNIPPRRQSNAFCTLNNITFVLSNKVTSFGRGPENNFCIKGDMYISNTHAKIYFEDGEFIIIDENSTNGTFVNRNPIYKNQPFPLKNGDVIQFGVKTVLEFTYFSV